jgi:hypothetical protein
LATPSLACELAGLALNPVRCSPCVEGSGPSHFP